MADGFVMLDLLQDILTRQWHDLLQRPSGPMSFRFLLQPVMGIAFAIRDGLKDSSQGRPPYFWSILTDGTNRGARVRDGLKATGRIIILGIVMDTIYQIRVFDTVYPLELVIIVLGLAFLPYVLVRGPVNRIASWWRQRHLNSKTPATRK